MPWNPEHYNVKTKEKPKPTHSEPIKDSTDDWWERHKSYIDHRKEFPYYPDKNKK